MFSWTHTKNPLWYPLGQVIQPVFNLTQCLLTQLLYEKTVPKILLSQGRQYSLLPPPLPRQSFCHRRLSGWLKLTSIGKSMLNDQLLVLHVPGNVSRISCSIIFPETESEWPLHSWVIPAISEDRSDAFLQFSGTFSNCHVFSKVINSGLAVTSQPAPHYAWVNPIRSHGLMCVQFV